MKVYTIERRHHTLTHAPTPTFAPMHRGYRGQSITHNSNNEMSDLVNYAIPLGIVGRLANDMFVEKRVNAIFDYRFKALEELFKDDKTKIRKSA
jgi:hypothetical protein